MVKHPSSPKFFQSYAEVTKRPDPIEYMTHQMIDDFLCGASMPAGKRSQEDLRKWALRFQREFGDDPALLFEERASRGEVNAWRLKWAHSPKQHDDAGTHAVRILNWAVEEGKIKEHHCHKLKRL